MPLFSRTDSKLNKLSLIQLDKEKALQKLVEENLLTLLDIHFLYSEYPTTDRGRIDTLGIDDTGAPVIIEYKRNRSDNVINQALSYLKWLKAQKVEFFEMLVIKRLGADKVQKIDWLNPRVICIAESYSKFDLDTLEVISLRLELYKYRYYENNIFLLENVISEDEKAHIIETETSEIIHKPNTKPAKKKIITTLDDHLKKGQPNIVDIFFTIQAKIFELDENIQQKVTNPYIGFKVSKLFLEVHIQRNRLLLYLRPIDYLDPKGIISKVPDTHNWVLDRRIYIDCINDIDYSMKLIEQSYKDVL